MAVRRVAPVAPAVSLALSLALLAVSGCGGDPVKPPPFTPSPSALDSSSPTASASPTGPVEPTLPPEAAGEDRAAAGEFVEYWLGVMDYAGLSGDTARLKAVTGKACTGCTGIIDFIDRTSGDGGTIEGGAWTALQLEPVQPSHGADFGFVTPLEFAPQIVRSRTGEVTLRSPAARSLGTFYVTHAKGGWRMRWLVTSDS